MCDGVPQHESLLATTLGRVTSMAVSHAQDGERLEPNHVYAIPPDADLSISRGVLALSPGEDAVPPVTTAIAREDGLALQTASSG